ncbi:glycosyl hydrolase [Patulibacter sp. SYSU D01012]|uniref:glycosyl hydrolase n=1 Tax=Patulibacter sp. SYSU D01012 TaxID=2817381 RepID=UPI001B31578D|nr:glycosyl hydrolase [Patulibacter sp. SYSU D01012]
MAEDRTPSTPDEAADGASPRGLTRRTVVGAAVATGAAAALPWNAATAGATSAPRATGQLARSFADPPAEYRARFRWWWPNGQVDLKEVAREVDQMVDAGFGGAEIADVHHSMRGVGLDVETYGWGGPHWVAALTTALTQARRRGVQLDVTIGPSWPAAAPTITPDDDAASKELVHGRAVVEPGATFDGPLPASYVAPEDGVTREELLAVHAFRVAASSTPTAKTVVLDLDSRVDLTDQVTQDERLTWTAPADRPWILLAFRIRGTGQQPESGPHTSPTSYVIDHFSEAGSRVMIDLWEDTILTPQLRRLLRDAGRTIFQDSLEFEATTFWTPDLLEQFRVRKGYDLLPLLAAVVRQKESIVFKFDDETSRRLLNDYWEVLGQLFDERHIGVLKPWINSLGMGMRMQPYGLQTDAMHSAALLDVSEGESLGFKNLDDYRSLAGGRDMAGKQLLSNEAAAFANGAYSTTWKAVLQKLNPIFTAGVNETVLHGFSYADAPNAQWPGFAAFSPYNGGPGYGESWGPRQPTWRHAPEIADYFGRAQYVLRQGRAQADVAFLRQKGYAGSGFGAAWFSNTGVKEGWSLEFVAPSLLRLPSAVVRNGVLAPDGPAFKALVFEGDAFANKLPVLPPDTARKLVEFAKAGLPIIVIGDWAQAQAYGGGTAGDDAEVRALVLELLAQPTVAVVPTRETVPDGIAKLGLRPSVQYDTTTSPLLSSRRVDGAIDWFLFANGSTTAEAAHAVTLPRRIRSAVPFALDPWTGEIQRVAVYDEPTRDSVRIRVKARPGQTLIYALAPRLTFGLRAAVAAHATASEAEVRADGLALVVRSPQAGTFATTLPGGRTVATRIPDVPAARELTGWTLDVESFEPGATATETRIVRIRKQLDALAPWTAIPGLQDVSGVGTYTTTVDLERSWPTGAGALLDLGAVSDTFRVTVNGRRLPPADQLQPVVDVGPYLRRGRNTIAVEVATPLLNRLRVSNAPVFGGSKPLAYGLLGPVRLLPYVERILGARR